MNPFSPSLLVALGVPFLLGAGVLRCLGLSARTDRYAFWAWAWLVGSLLAGMVWFAWSWRHPDWSNVLWIDGGLVLVSALAWSAAALHGDPRASLPRRATSRESLLLAGVVGFCLLLVLHRIALASLVPVWSGDEAHFWSLKAKMLYRGGGFGSAFEELLRRPSHGANADYPPLGPLQQLMVFVHRGQITHFANRLPLQMAQPALVLALAGALAQRVRPALAAVILLAFTTIPVLRTTGIKAMCDVPLALAILIALDAILRARRAANPKRWYALAGLAAAAAIAYKHEGLFLVAAFLCGLIASQILRPRALWSSLRPSRTWLVFAPALVTLGSIWLTNRHYALGNEFIFNRGRESSLLDNLLGQMPDRLPTVLEHFGSLGLVEGRHTAGLGLVFLALLLLAPRTAFGNELRPLTLAFLAAMAGYALIFTGLPNDMAWHLSTASDRVLFHITPALALYCACIVGRLVPWLTWNAVGRPSVTKERSAARPDLPSKAHPSGRSFP